MKPKDRGRERPERTLRLIFGHSWGFLLARFLPGGVRTGPKSFHHVSGDAVIFNGGVQHKIQIAFKKIRQFEFIFNIINKLQHLLILQHLAKHLNFVWDTLLENYMY